jgi:atypical dual specificity phosphatase
VSDWFRSYGFADVYNNLIVGALPLDQSDVRFLERIGVNRVLNLVEDREYSSGSRNQVEQALDAAGIVEQRLSSADYGSLSNELLEESAHLISGWLDEGLVVYLHCRAGWQRSATVAAAVVASREGLEPEQALAQIRARKPTADPLPHQKDDLRAWWNGRKVESTGT